MYAKTTKSRHISILVTPRIQFGTGVRLTNFSIYLPLQKIGEKNTAKSISCIKARYVSQIISMELIIWDAKTKIFRLISNKYLNQFSSE